MAQLEDFEWWISWNFLGVPYRLFQGFQTHDSGPGSFYPNHKGSEAKRDPTIAPTDPWTLGIDGLSVWSILEKNLLLSGLRDGGISLDLDDLCPGLDRVWRDFVWDIFLPGPRTMDGFFPENSEIFDVSKGSEHFEISIVWMVSIAGCVNGAWYPK